MSDFAVSGTPPWLGIERGVLDIHDGCLFVMFFFS